MTIQPHRPLPQGITILFYLNFFFLGGAEFILFSSVVFLYSLFSMKKIKPYFDHEDFYILAMITIMFIVALTVSLFFTPALEVRYFICLSPAVGYLIAKILQRSFIDSKLFILLSVLMLVSVNRQILMRSPKIAPSFKHVQTRLKHLMQQHKSSKAFLLYQNCPKTSYFRGLGADVVCGDFFDLAAIYNDAALNKYVLTTKEFQDPRLKFVTDVADSKIYFVTSQD